MSTHNICFCGGTSDEYPRFCGGTSNVYPHFCGGTSNEYPHVFVEALLMSTHMF